MNAFGFHVDPECLAVFNELKIRRKHRYIVYGLKENTFCVDHIGSREEEDSDFVKYLNTTEAKYIVTDHDYVITDQYSMQGRPQSKIFFISWIPTACPVDMKMAFTASKFDFKNTFSGVVDVDVFSLPEIYSLLGDEESDDSDSDSDSSE
ncbi:hypothetical protein WA158_001481 [Blastocystis sp. Blastoise]